ncbi:MAG: hypothetical protein M1480_06600 [Bacteroidetes bacterium]|nr:hypothetical protein [Bacteroidota bacterium]
MHNQIYAESDKEITELKALAENTTLRSLNLAENKIGTTALKQLSKNTALRSLNLSNNQISNEGVIALANNIILRSLYLSNNQLEDKDVITLAANKTLRRLSLDSNQINLENPGALSALLNSTSLRVLDLFDVHMKDDNIINLLANTSLRSLKIPYWHILDKTDEDMPVSKKLRILDGTNMVHDVLRSPINIILRRMFWQFE